MLCALRSAVAELTAQSPGQDDPKGPQLREVITEFGRHLDMLAEQLGASLSEADRDCVSVGESFHELAAAKSTLDGIGCPEPERSLLRGAAKQMGESLYAAIIALQYHDRLAQRLVIIRAGLDRLQTLLHDDSPRTHQEWLHSLRQVEQLNCTERQRLAPDPASSAAGPAADPMLQSSVELF